MYWLNMILGLALMASPFALGYSSNTTALWSSIFLGTVITLASGYKALVKDVEHWEDWVDVVAGVIAVLVPFIFGFSALPAALWACIIFGVLVAAFSTYQIYGNRLA